MTHERPQAENLTLSLPPVFLFFVGRPQGHGRHVAVHHAQIDAGLFPHVSARQNHARAPAPRVPHPRVFLKGGAAVNGGNLLGDVELGLAEHLFHLNQEILVVALKVGDQLGETETFLFLLV